MGLQREKGERYIEREGGLIERQKGGGLKRQNQRKIGREIQSVYPPL